MASSTVDNMSLSEVRAAMQAIQDQEFVLKQSYIDGLIKRSTDEKRPSSSSGVAHLHVNQVTVTIQNDYLDHYGLDGRVAERVLKSREPKLAIEAVRIAGDMDAIQKGEAYLLTKQAYLELQARAGRGASILIEEARSANAALEAARIDLANELDIAKLKLQQAMIELEELRRRPPVVYEASF